METKKKDLNKMRPIKFRAWKLQTIGMWMIVIGALMMILSGICMMIAMAL